ncbi:leucyl aminopeptidase family protein [Sphingomonas sabuli]|uniref:Leucyl aminopeptidase family protein n=1 Tax=Sphingomonas sabuli TaxID=2764186 RepID=A0A7G9L2A6_9SPHN|nr:leucyl aminopeptidase family protein [Sphingomonas sabuli]QNM82755.1 leucyl aminopeptidase family protein [Sphingomonas sabuli]
MTDFAALLAADRGQSARPIHLVDKDSFGDWVRRRPAEDRALLEANRFDGKTGYARVVLPRGNAFEVVSTVANVDDLSPWCLAKLSDSLPEGTYRLAEGQPGKAALGWLLAQHRFDTFKSKPEDAERGPRVLVTGEAAAVDPAVRLATATALVRDLVNTPALQLGPAELEQAVRDRLSGTGADIAVTKGDALDTGYPLIAAVGGAAVDDRAPRLIEAEWGKPDHPRLAIVGKGVCFDTGGLDLKPGSGMRLMKKDMGGAAHALALAWLVIAARLPVRLHLLIPAVENAVSGAALRPGDVVKSRQGLQVEIDNTDAEGRLILADALAKAAEAGPELIVDFATLTGAARIALGPDLPALFVTDDDLAGQIEAGARQADDPLWRMPLWDAYDEMLKSDVADLANASGSPMAGAVTAAMFMKRFLPDGLPWAHLDTFAWRDSAKPGRPKGGEALGLRAVFAALQNRFTA